MGLRDIVLNGVRKIVPLACAAVLALSCGNTTRIGALPADYSQSYTAGTQHTQSVEYGTSLEKLLADKLMAEVDVNKVALKAPQGDANRVDDLSLVKGADERYALLWSYRNLGDYNQDGIVDIADITPIAQHYNEEVNDYNEWIDGSGDGRIGISDVTAIAQNYFSECVAYKFNPEPLNWVTVATLEDAVNDGKRKKFRVTEDEFPYVQPGRVLYVVPFDSTGFAINAPTSNMVRVQGYEYDVEVTYQESADRYVGKLEGRTDVAEENWYAEITINNWTPYAPSGRVWGIEPGFDHGFLDWAWEWMIYVSMDETEATQHLPTKADLTISVYEGQFNENTMEWEKAGKLLWEERDFVNFFYSGN